MSVTSKLSLSLLLLAGGALPVHAQISSQQPIQYNPRAPISFVDMQHNRFQCGAGETKHLILKGVEDNFSGGNSEPATKSPRVASQTHSPAWNSGVGSSFDGTSVNRKIFSFLQLPPNVTKGRFMIGLSPLGEILQTDGMAIGNLGDSSPNVISTQRAGYSYASGSWTAVNGSNMNQSGTNYWADFNGITLLDGVTTLQNSIDNGEDLIDVYVQDDHSVDYVAASVCSKKDTVNVPGEHFQCYTIEKGDQLKEEIITIQDQFGRSQTVLGRPKILCNPSMKTHNDKTFRIRNKERHLVCYEYAKPTDMRPINLEISNQFATDQVVATRDELFCVPSLKKHMDGDMQNNEKQVQPIRYRQR